MMTLSQPPSDAYLTTAVLDAGADPNSVCPAVLTTGLLRSTSYAVHVFASMPKNADANGKQLGLVVLDATAKTT